MHQGHVGRRITRRTLLKGTAAGAVGTAASSVLGPSVVSRRAVAQEATTVRLISPPSSPVERGALEQILDTFMEANPTIRVEYQAISSEYNTKLQTDLAAGTAADVYTLDSMPSPDFMASGVMEPLDNYMAQAGFTPADFYPGLISAYQYQGVTYGIPKDFSTLGMIYDTDALQAAGITTPPATWDDLRTAAQTLLDSTGQPPIVFAPSLDRYIAFHYAAGARVLSEDGSQIVINSPEAKTALDFYYGLYKDGLAATFTDVGAEWPGDAFAKGLASIVFEGPWVLEFLETNAPDRTYGIAEMPAGPGGKATMAFTVCYAINPASQVKDAAWSLISYLTGPEGMATWTETSGLLPSRPALAPAYLETYPDRAPFLAGGDYARPWQLGQGGEKFNLDAKAEIESLFAEQKSVDETLAALQAKAEQDIRLAPASGTPAAAAGS